MAVFTFNVTFTVLSHHTRPVFLVSGPLVYEQRGVRRAGIQNDAVLPKQEALQEDGHRNEDLIGQCKHLQKKALTRRLAQPTTSH